MDTFQMNDYLTTLALFNESRRFFMKPSQDQTFDAYSYRRYSSLPQGDGDSMRRQTEALNSWLARNPQAILDKTLTLEDPGVPAYCGEHRTRPTAALARFLEHLEGGRVRPGSYLIVENLDRLTRENPVDAIPFLLSLIKKGIRIVQLSPYEMVYDADMDQGKLVGLLFECSRGHGESSRKAGMIAEHWKGLRERMRGGERHGGRIPAWLVFEGGEFHVKPGAQRAIRRIFDWCIEGYGMSAIMPLLQRYKIPPFGGPTWTRRYVGYLLHDRRLLGEHQPRCGRRAGGGEAGEVIAGYFPRIIDDTLWHDAQKAIASRTGKSGRPARGGGPKTPFAGLIRSADDGSRIQASERGSRRQFISARAVGGFRRPGEPTFPVADLVDGLLSSLKEVSAADVFADPSAAELHQLEAELGEVQRKLDVASKRWEADPESAFWQDKASAYDRERREVVKRMKAVERSITNPATASWAQAVELMKRNDPARLRQALLTVVSEVWCLFVWKGKGRKVAAVQVWFTSGKHRDYLIASDTPMGCKAKERGSRWKAFSLSAVVEQPFDLRDRQNAAALREVLETVAWDQVKP